jgi:hypothetical protein
MQMFTELGHWLGVPDGDPRAFALFEKHYSYRPYQDGRRRYGYRNRFLIAGPGEKMVLLTTSCDALFVWRKFQSADGQQGVNCAVFRNESPLLSSMLVLEAEQRAWQRWPGERLYTYVDPKSVKSRNPGYCFICAKWRRCGVTKARRLLILEKQPPVEVR